MEKNKSPPFSREIEITIISAENLLTNHKQPLKKSTFAAVRYDLYSSKGTKKSSTRTKQEASGSNPTWNEKLVMELPVHARFLTVEVRSGRKVFGCVHIPVSDFMCEHLPENHLSFLSYRLKNGDGDKNGIINLSVKVINRRSNSSVDNVNKDIASRCNDITSQSYAGKVSDDHGDDIRVVTGIPVAYKY